jgi:hypothetical protein
MSFPDRRIIVHFPMTEYAEGNCNFFPVQLRAIISIDRQHGCASKA